MIETDVINKKAELTQGLRQAIKRTNEFHSSTVLWLLTIDTANKFLRQVILAKSPLFNASRTPFTVRGETAGQAPHWTLERKEGSGIVVAKSIIYDDPGYIEQTSRRHVVFYHGNSKYPIADNEEAFYLVGEEIQKFAEMSLNPKSPVRHK